MLKKKLKKVVSIFQWLLTVVLVSVVLLLIFTTFNPIKSFQVLRVMSGSMEPAIKVGSVAFVQKVKPKALKKGEIITYASAEDPNMSVTHRLVAIEEKEGKTVFITKGDVNNTEDITEVSSSQIKGRVIFSLPFLGYLSVWVRKPLGFGLLVILPAFLIIISEILNIKKAIEKEVEKKYAKPEKQQKSESIGSLLIFFLLGISLFQIKPTNAYFSDVIVIEGNTFSMADVWPPPTPTPASVVINEVYYDVKDDDTRGTENKNEWIELYNNSNNPVNLKDWSLVEGAGTVKNINPNVSIPAKGFIVLSHDHSTWSLYWSLPSGVSSINLTGSGEWLNNGGDKLILKNDKEEEVDLVAWGSYVPGWNLNANDGKSIARKIKGVDTDSPDDWGVLDNPNPGTNPHPSEEYKEEVESVSAEEELALEEPTQESSEVVPEDEVVTEEVNEPTTGQSEEEQEEDKGQPDANQDAKQEEEQTVDNEDSSENSDRQNQPPAGEPPSQPQPEEQDQNQTFLPEEGSEINE